MKTVQKGVNADSPEAFLRVSCTLATKRGLADGLFP
jgi:hypothetical protein